MESQIRQQLKSALKKKRLAHALLWIGEDIAAKKQIALDLICALLGEQSSDRILKNSHPNVRWIDVEGESQDGDIRIGQIRQLKAEQQLQSYEEGPRVWVVMQAHKLTVAAANALLKLLEEPGIDQYLFLFAPSSSSVLPTILSRCLRLVVPVGEDSIGPLGDSQALAFLFKPIDAAALKQIEHLGKNRDELREELRKLLFFLHQQARQLEERSERLVLQRQIQGVQETLVLLEQHVNPQLALERLAFRNQERSRVKSS